MDICYIVGSRSYGLAIDDSDIDLVQTWDGPYIRSFDKSTNVNLIQVNRTEALKWLIDVDHAYLQWWFPAEVVEENELSDYMFCVREHFVKANAQNIYRSLFNHADALYGYLDWLYPTFPKRLAYSTLFYAILARYGQGMPMAQAHRMDGEIQAQLLAMRRKEMSLEEAQAINRAWREKAVDSAGFFDRAIDEQYLSQVRQDLTAILGLPSDS